ncbi:MAG TPA: 1-deoxy-D-xylulose-5-phosphate synthase [Planctomycetota bacterium]|nr:1-deoxy-D-xylulose-5-phosphate synthase [Planctomycetota bacterium]
MSDLLSRIRDTNDIHRLSPEELPALAEEIRRLILDVVLRTGGHLGSNLGVVELTLALHYTFDLKRDLIVWDGSYQTYTHKILTGRKEKFPTLRQFGGLCGFGWKPESETDPFNFGHVGTGLAAAFGCAIADERLGRRRKVVCVVGDGSLTSGVAFEALNNIGASKRDLLVILNDNGFSIARTVGALSTYFNELRTAPLYEEFKKELHTWLSKVPLGQPVEHFLESVRRGLKQALFPNMFTALGLQYYGPVDGHDLKALLHLLSNVRHQQKPVLLHVVTKKGKGHPDADRDQFALHKPVTFVRTDIRESKLEPGGAPRPAESPSYTHAFVEALTDLAARDLRIVAITAAMPDGTGLLEFGKRFPDRCYDVGISEQCALAFAAGLAHAGLRPVCAIYSTFVQRAYDMIFQELCLNNLPVVLVLDRAGIAGEDGPTHHGNFDIAFCRTLPNVVLMAPKDGRELREMLALALSLRQPSVLRIPREQTPDLGRYRISSSPLALGKGELLVPGRHGAILAYGVMTAKALEAREKLLREGLDVAVANARFAKPLDVDLAERLAREYPWVLTLEDHAALGGFGGAVLEALSLRNADTSRVKIHAIPDRFLQHADRTELLKFLHLDAEGVADVCRMIAAGQPRPSLDPSLRKNFLYEEE